MGEKAARERLQQLVMREREKREQCERVCRRLERLVVEMEKKLQDRERKERGRERREERG